MQKRETEREGRKLERREGGRGSAEAERAGGQAEMKAERERTPYTQDMLGEHRSLLGPVEDTLSNCFINSN